MRQTLAKTPFALAVVLLLALGFLAMPADVEAQTCRSTFLGCGFSHVECQPDFGACCCFYECSDGSTRKGLCWQMLQFTAEAPTSLLDQLLAMEPAVETEEAPAAVEEPAAEPVAEPAEA